MNKRLAMIIGITIAVHMDVAGDPGAALKTKMSGKIKAPCKSLSPDQQKTELIVLMMPFQDLDSKKTDADYRFYVEKIVNVVNCYIDTHRPQQWDDESSPWILRECEPLMYDPVTASLYSCICPAVTEGKKIDLGEALATVNEELKNRQKRSQLKKTPVHDVVRLK